MWHSRSLTISWLVATLTTQLVRADGIGGLITCYGYNGTARGYNTRCPGSDACCGPDSTCYSNRLCKKDNDNYFVRGPCAVKSWDKGQCPQLCLHAEGQIFPRVGVCPDGSFCCEQDGPSCCSQKRGVFLDVTGNIAKAPASTTMTWGPERTMAGYQTITTKGAAASTASGLNVASPTPDSNGKDDSNGIKIGAGVGVTASVIVLGGTIAAFVLWRRRKGQKKKDEAGELEGSGPLEKVVLKVSPVLSPLPSQELDSTQVHRSELPA